MLIPHQLLLFFEVSYDLLQRLFEDLDLALKDLNLFPLVFAARPVLILGPLVQRDISLEVLVERREGCDFSFVVIYGVPL